MQLPHKKMASAPLHDFYTTIMSAWKKKHMDSTSLRMIHTDFEVKQSKVDSLPHK